jgi:hypothetical protein
MAGVEADRAGAADPPPPPPAPRLQRLEALAPAVAPVVDGDLSDWPAAGPLQEAVIDREDQVHPAYREAWRGGGRLGPGAGGGRRQLPLPGR